MKLENKPLISVIVPIYKSAAYMHQCVDSLLAQTYQNTEIILVNDGSPDESGEIADAMAAANSKIQVIHKKNGGTASTCNAGLNAAKGEYITFMDADDWVHPEMVERLYRLCVEYDAPISMGELQEVYTRETPTEFITDDIEVMDQRTAIGELIEDKRVRCFYQAKLFKTELFDQVRFTEGMSYEDVAIMQDLFLLADRLVYTPSVFCYYYQHSESILHSRNLQLNFDQLAAFQLQMDHILEKYPEYRTVLELKQYKFELSTMCFYLAEYRKEQKYDKQVEQLWNSMSSRYRWLEKQKNTISVLDRLRYFRCKLRL